ncbi:penicillin acylase family protein [Pseudoalteromonas luteoviolacea]|uniref:Penicilin amidase n=1 Tax=Pseudoalteromonas luteoviolacea (strain 2ta16) TaxID=1353533 RepID=V4HRY5_PSEL2|nr:penicillin acylase family protein [Pseudoalteromonas luteoviolacea]ESP93580.1 penicilin amidase [Pseudoalteromonas luteoviolacea 2ta16]KZN34467.1 hypothetical protein N483_25055 [Pseudoalteromonas luteoviolacea NCIMB 1944]
MLKWFRVGASVLVIGILTLTAAIYGVLSLSLPALDGHTQSSNLQANSKLSRDALGQAVIHAQNRQDAAYTMGYAHGQDRFFQMDLLRRNAAGELSELFGEGAVSLDKSLRFHQFRKRSEEIFATLSAAEQTLLHVYAQGVNDGRLQSGMSNFEYLLLGAQAQDWRPADSLLVIFSMYLDLQTATFRRDKTLIHIAEQFGQPMVDFILQPSKFQAALDDSQLSTATVPIPALTQPVEVARNVTKIEETPLYGSNNWAVTGSLTETGAAMVSDDMHLGLNVPSIWYRAQINYHTDSAQPVTVTGVSLPGVPAIVVGSNEHIAWGFTNGYLDTADWIVLSEQDEEQTVLEEIKLPNGEVRTYALSMSQFGPVKQFNGKRYALQWVAHQPYAVNLNLLQLEQVVSVEQALKVASDVGIPVQNLMVVDKQGNAAWQPIGALPSRVFPSDLAVSSVRAESLLWKTNEAVRPHVINPDNGKLWTANSRVMSAIDHRRFGDGGYALGARAVQIRDRLLAAERFTETDFNTLQLDNEARFLMPWHDLLVDTLTSASGKEQNYKQALAYLANWQACACTDSVGYTLVKFFRKSVIDIVFSPVEQYLQGQDETLAHLARYFEPALWQLIQTQPKTWLAGHQDWQHLLEAAYLRTHARLQTKFGAGMANWTWGEVNTLTVQHPFSQQMPFLSRFLDMPAVPGFGDSYMPAVQGKSFGASQRFIAQPGHLENAVMTVAGGQSGHPLSPYYRKGFSAYAEGQLTPLLPGSIQHTIEFSAQ